MFSIIVAMGKNNEIGKNNKMMWNVPDDLKNFKKITTGKKIIMGRNTYESIGRPLPNRKNIILSKTLNQKDITYDKLIVKVYDDTKDVVSLYKDCEEEVFIIGGAEIYNEFMDLADKLYISFIDFEDKTANTYFPIIDYEKYNLEYEEQNDGWKFCIYKRK